MCPTLEEERGKNAILEKENNLISRCKPKSLTIHFSISLERLIRIFSNRFVWKFRQLLNGAMITYWLALQVDLKRLFSMFNLASGVLQEVLFCTPCFR